MAEHLALVFELCEVFHGIEGWWDSVGDGESSFLGCSLPVAGPCCVGGGLGSTESKFSGCPYCALQASCVTSLACTWPLIIDEAM